MSEKIIKKYVHFVSLKCAADWRSNGRCMQRSTGDRQATISRLSRNESGQVVHTRLCHQAV